MTLNLDYPVLQVVCQTDIQAVKRNTAVLMAWGMSLKSAQSPVNSDYFERQMPN